LANRPVVWLWKLADIADISADHEAEQMLGINALCANTARKSAETHTNTARQIFELIAIHYGNETTALLTDIAPYHNVAQRQTLRFEPVG